MPTIDRPHVAEEADRLAARLLPPAVVRELSRLEPRVALLHLATEWAMILGTACLSARFFHPVSYLVAVAFIGARQHALLLLMHESAHHRLTPNRRANDWIGELVAWPFLVVRVRGYRSTHFAHHRHLNTMADPDWALGDPRDVAHEVHADALLGLPVAPRPGPQAPLGPRTSRVRHPTPAA